MSAYVSAFTVSGGVPLFSRKFGSLQSLPFPLLASLNGVAMFAKMNDATLLGSITSECQFLWKDYHNSIRLIGALPSDTMSQIHFHRLLDNVFQALILIVGLEDLIGQRNIEKLKKEIRAAYPLIDRLLESAQPSDKLTTFGDMIGATDCIAFPESSQFLTLLESFAEMADSSYGCVTCEGRMVCATKNWWALHPDEIQLLADYLESDRQSCTLKDVPVFLPLKSPTVPFRLIVCYLLPSVAVCALCGPNPSLIELEPSIMKIFKQSLPLTTSLQSIQPRSFPPVPIDNSILAFILVNLEKRRALSSLQPHFDANKEYAVKQPLTPGRKADILRTFYRMTVGPIFPDAFVPTPYGMDQTTGEAQSSSVSQTKVTHPVSETFLNFEYYKCFAMRHLQFQFFAIFVGAVPNHSMRNISQRTMQLLTKEKSFAIIS